MSHHRKKSEVKLITSGEQIEQLTISQIQGMQPPTNTPMTPGQKSPWRNIQLDNDSYITWDTIVGFAEDVAFEPQTKTLAPNTYTRSILKGLMKLDFRNVQKVQRIRKLELRKCTNELTQAEFTHKQQADAQSTTKQQQPANANWQQSQQTPTWQQSQQLYSLMQQTPVVAKPPQMILVRQTEDPLVKQKKEEMKENYKWLGVQQKDSTKGVQFTKDLKFKLNQLAPQNFKAVGEQILEMFLNNLDMQDITIQYILEKGAIEDKYRHLYVRLLAQIIQSSHEKIQKMKQYIKGLLLAQFVPPDYGKIVADLQYIDEDEKIIYLTKRKKKYIGYGKYIATMVEEKVYTHHLMDQTILGCLRSFLTQYKIKDKIADLKRISEEPLEAIIAMVQVCGASYVEQEQEDGWTHTLDKLSRNILPEVTQHFSKEGLLQLVDCLINNFVISQRVSILLQNAREEIANDFKRRSKVKKQQESSDEEERSDTRSPKKRYKNQPQTPMQRIQEDDDDQLLSSKKPLTDKDVILVLSECFKRSTDNLSRLMGRITKESHWVLFWKTYFNNLLDINSANLARVHQTYRIYQPFCDFCAPDLVMKEMSDALQDKIFDIVESPRGFEFMTGLLKEFLHHHFPAIMNLRLEDPQEEIQTFYIKLLGRIISQEVLHNQVATLSEFLVQNLQLNVEQQQTMWESIK